MKHLLLSAAFAVFSTAAFAGPQYVDETGFAVSGYDVVAYFSLPQSAVGSPQAEAVPLYPFLQALRRRGLRLGVATNDAEMPARAHLTAAGVVELFDFVAGSDSGFGAKPGPGQLQGFLQAMDLLPEQVLMVGDSLHDLRAGRAAGMRTAAVLTGIADTQQLEPYADVVLPDIGHLPAWLDR